MTAALIDKPRRRVLRARCHDDRDPRMTLEQRLDATLVAAKAGESADCPLCHGTMRPTGEGAACGDCGSRLT
jgi:hypothetical protein